MDKFKVAILGCTGLVGQRFVQLLANHPFFEIEALVASEKSAGRKYYEVTKWVIESEIPENIRDMRVIALDPDKLPKVDLVFSALPADIAKIIEPEFARRGFIVISNASNERLEPDVPLIVPEINLDHLKLIEVQRKKRNWKGVLVKNPNCTTIILTLSLKPLLDEFGIEKVVVTTMQAISGAGIGSDAVLGMQIVDNIIPFIKGEEEKVENESLKILGQFTGSEIKWINFIITATTTRVPVLDGHLESVYVELGKEVEIDDVIKVFEKFSVEKSLKKFGLPTAPEKPIVLRNEIDRPQPRLDRMEGNGMSVVIGRIRKVKGVKNAIKYLVLGHNVIRGAAGNTVLIGEVLTKLMPELIT